MSEGVPTVERLIERLDRSLVLNRPDYYAHLQPGVTASQLDDFDAKFCLRLTNAFRLLYSWRNGHDMNRSESIQQNLMFSSVEDITGFKAMMDDMIGSDFEDPKWWRRSWVPFLENGAGDHLCLDLAAEDAGTPGQVLMFYHDWEARPIRFPSLEAWLAHLVESMENGTLDLS